MNVEHSRIPGVLIENVGPRHVARLMVRRGAEGELGDRVRAHLALELPQRPQRTGDEHLAMVGLGPGSWLVMDLILSQAFMPRLKFAVGPTASVCDLSDAYSFRRIMGLKARACLAKLVSIDLHATRFPVGSAASTRAAHVPVLLWRLTDDENRPAFELGVPRSYAQYVHQALEHAAASFQARP